ncbi:NUDIX domain-containing protein [Cytophagaceae bacterium 50C-KIRBA]|uniref:NUDIX domain-containing protein n=1 Tax=Aquirufa beregesia TaxID=2516556 RepID=A0ABX0F188_9BACT|nr:NUDIX domain-containing protein [Aquirufa beregesia]NGZ43605.1 NUDIX domain-containing protein [Aquirufa beregesia]
MNEFNLDQYLPHLSIDCVIFGYEGKELKILISKSKLGDNFWALPGGYIKKSEGIDKAASRILYERTALKNIYLEQFRVFGHETRIVESPYNEALRLGYLQYDATIFTEEVISWLTDRFVCIGYYALVDIQKVTTQNREFDELLEWRNIQQIPNLMHDHNSIVEEALTALRLNFDAKLIGFNLLPEVFTMREIQELYETVYERNFANNNFQKKMLDLKVLERLEKKFTGAQNKAPYLYRFVKK